MSLNKIVKVILYRLFGWTIYKKAPLGTNPYENILHFYKRPHEIKVFFDVGSNIGQTEKAILQSFPEAKIYCFEPQKHVYDLLVKNTAGHQNTYCFNEAMGAVESVMTKEIDESFQFSSRFSLVHENEKQTTAKPQSIKVNTIDNFFDSNQELVSIDYLKIDTEGYEMEVLKGSIANLENKSIKFIEAEVSFNDYNTHHVSFSAIKNFLADYGYEVFGIYEQTHEWKKKRSVIRRANVVFVHSSYS